MDCSHCGQPNEPGSLFCQNCGSRMEPVAPPPPEPAQTQPLWSAPVLPPPSAPAYGAETGPTRRTREKRGKGGKGAAVTIILGALCALLAVVVVLMAFGVTDAVFSPQQKTFKTPEDAIEYFISHVKSGDYEGAMAACAVEEVAQHLDYEAMLKWVQAMPPSMQYLPSEYKMYAAFNETSVKNQIMRQLAYMAMSAALPDDYDGFLYDNMTLYGEQIDYGDVVKDMDPEDFISIEIVEIGQSDWADDDFSLDNMEEQAEINGADQMAAYDVLYDIGGDYYAGGVTLLRYDDEWLIFSLIDPLLGQPISGALIPLDSKSDFDDLLGGDYTGPEEPASSASTEVTVAPSVEVSIAPTEEPATFFVGVSMMSMASTWSEMQANDISEALASYGCDVIVSYAEYDIARQMSQIEDFIVMGVDAIVVAPMDPAALMATLMQVRECGIAVILLGNDLYELDGLYDCAIGYDYYNDAYILAKWMEDNLSSNIQIGEITGAAGIEVCIDRSEGLYAVADQNPGWTVVASISADFSTEESMVAAEDMIVAYPGLDVLFCQTDAMALGAAQAVMAAGLQGEVLVVGIGNMADTLDAIRSGQIAAVSSMDLYVGGLVAEAVNDILTGRSVEQQIFIPSFIIDQSNVDEMDYLGY